MPATRTTLYLSGDAAADKLLAKDPFALLVGMVLDQQIPLEWAFYGPLNLTRRLADVSARAFASMAEDDLVAAFVAKPALHRYPAAMARRVHELSQQLVAEYGGDAAKLWNTADTGAELLRRVKRLPGFGEQKAKIFVALLGKQFGVRPEGWEAASAPFSEPGSHMSVADIESADTLALVREHKREMKAAKKAAAATSLPAKKVAAKKVAAKKVAAKKVAAKKAAPAKKVAPRKAPAKRLAAAKRSST